MNINIRGGANLSVIDRETGEVKVSHSFNLITKYGLSRILAPKDREEKVATHLCIGYKEDEPSVEEDLVPSNYFIAKCNETIDEWSNAIGAASCNWRILLGTELPIGFVFNHVYLARKDDEGILRPLTSLKFRNGDGTPFEYTHTERNSVGINYSIDLLLGEVTGSSNFVKAARITSNVSTYDSYLWDDRALAGKGKSYESSSATRDSANYAYISSHNGYFNDEGNWIQIYEIVIKPLAYSEYICFRMGISFIYLATTRGRGSETIELKFEISDMPEIYDEPVPMTSVSAEPSPDGTRTVTFRGAPYQSFEVYSGNYLLLTQTLGSQGRISVGSNPTTVIDVTTGLSLPAPESYMLSSGGKLRIVTKTRKGTAETTLIAPDLQADDVKAIWFTSPTTIRAVANYNDEISISWDKEFTAYTTRVNSINKGKCTTVFPEDDRYYYCDIDVSEFDPQIHRRLQYTCTDAAGNVFDSYRNSSRKLLINYVEGINYFNAHDFDYEYGLRSNYPITSDMPDNDYHLALKVLSGGIS